MTDLEFKKAFDEYHTGLLVSIKAITGSHRKSELIAVYCFIALRLIGTDDPKSFLFKQAMYECKRFVEPQPMENWYIRGDMLRLHVIISLVNAIQSLSPEHVELIVALRYRGLTLEETAIQIGTTVDSVRVQHAKAKRILYSSISDQTYLL